MNLQTFSAQLMADLTLQAIGLNTKPEDFCFRNFVLKLTKDISH